MSYILILNKWSGWKNVQQARRAEWFFGFCRWNVENAIGAALWHRIRAKASTSTELKLSKHQRHKGPIGFHFSSGSSLWSDTKFWVEGRKRFAFGILFNNGIVYAWFLLFLWMEIRNLKCCLWFVQSGKRLRGWGGGGYLLAWSWFRHVSIAYLRLLLFY